MPIAHLLTLRRPRRARTWLLTLGAVSSLVLFGCKSEENDASNRLSGAQREVVDELRARLDSRDVTEDEFDALRAQIQPIARLNATVKALGRDRRGVNDLIDSQGYTGQEDCWEPPDYMTISEIVPTTPIDPTTRLQRRANIRNEDTVARTTLDAWLSGRGSAPTLDVAHASSDVDRWGRYHARYRQTHEGVPLTKGGVIVHETSSGSQTVSDFTLEGISVDTTPAIAKIRAGELALAAVDPTGALGYQATPVLMIEPQLENALLDPTAPENGASYEWRVTGAQLVYQVVVAPDYSDLNTTFDTILASSSVTLDESSDPPDREANTLLGGREEASLSDEVEWTYPTATPWLVTLDANTEEVLAIESLLEEDLADLAAPPTIGTGYGYFNSRVDLNTTYWPPLNAYVLADFSRSKPNQPNMVMHGRNLDSHDVADFDLLLDQNNVWGNGLVDFDDPACIFCSKGQTPAVDIAFGVQRTYDFMSNVLGRWGTDDEGKPQIAIAHWDMNYIDAHHNGSSGLIAFGNGEDDTGPGNYSLGTVAHEIGHAIWQQEDVGKSGNPAKAMNEGHGDVLGGLVDIYQDNTDGQGDWLYRIPWAGGHWRGRTRDPAGYEECKTNDDIEVCKFGSRYWDFFTEIETFEHVGGIPFTRAIMHLAEGSSTDPSSPYFTNFFSTQPMRGIGLNKAAAIWIHMVSHFLPDSPNLAEARFAAWQAAEDLYGANSTEAKATANAFAAVGMGAPAPGPAAPTIPFAKVHSFNHRTLTARTYAVLDDDTGAEFVEPVGMARKNDAFLGYLDLSEMQVGKNTVTFRVVDTDGNEASATRICRLQYRPQLLDDGGFEESSGSAWSGANKGEDEGGAFFGDKYLKSGSTPVRQTVDLGVVEGPELSYWVAANKGVEPGDYLRVRVLDAGLGELAVLTEHDIDDAWFPRPARSNGYLNFRHDLSDWEGQQVVIEFAANRNGLFRIDHAVVSYSSVQLLPPGVEMFETDNSVFLTVTGDDFAPFDAMDLSPRIHVDGAEAGPIHVSGGLSAKHVVALAIDSLAPGAHFTNTIAVNADDAFVAAGKHEWFAPKPVNELLENGRFEDQLDGWAMDGAGVAIEDAGGGGKVFQGDYAVRLGDVGAVNEASISRDVVVPNGIKSLKFTARVRREYSGIDDDRLVVDFLNASNEVLDSAVLYDTAGNRLDHEPPHNFETHVLVSYAPSTAALAGKTVTVRLRTIEDDAGPSSFVVDNASLSYSEWGLQIGG